MSKSPDERPAIPTQAELEAAAGLMQGVVEATLHVLSNLSGVAHFKSARAPTFEEIGRVLAYSFDLEDRLDELQGYVTSTRKHLRDLDYVRALDNVDTDEIEYDDGWPASRKAPEAVGGDDAAAR